MELLKRSCGILSFPVVIFLLFAFLECHFCRKVDPDTVTTFAAKKDGNLPHNKRNSKQFILPVPVVVWPYALRTAHSNPANSYYLSSLLGQQYHSIPSFAETITGDGKFSQDDEQNVSGHASSSEHLNNNLIDSPIPCNTRDNGLGICKPFTECFPMMEVQYGNANYIDYMDVPLAEQLISNTNDSVCVQSEKLEENLKVCCPRPTLKNSNVISHGDNSLDERTNESLHDDIKAYPVITQKPPIMNTVYRQLVDENKCGKSKFLDGSLRQHSLKITGGQESRGPGEFPWMVAVFGKNKKILCGASLISDQFLLSASHCFSTFKPADIPHLYVHLGDFNIKTTTDGQHEVRRIEKIILHKGFNINNYHNDIALLKLNKPVNFTERISPICLPEPTMDSLEGRKIIVTGWGRKYRYGATVDVLRKVEVPVWKLQECKNLYSHFAPGRVLDSNICAGDGKRDKDACLGDSGGPAVMNDGTKFVLAGITSWGKGCGSFPGVYVNASYFLMWIFKNMNQFA